MTSGITGQNMAKPLKAVNKFGAKKGVRYEPDPMC